MHKSVLLLSCLLPILACSAQQTSSKELKSLAVSRRYVNFGTISKSKSDTTSITIKSNGISAITITDMSLDDAGGGMYAFGSPLPIILNPSQTTEIRILFDPLAAGEDDAILTLVTDSKTTPTILIKLKGFAYDPTMTLTKLKIE